MQSQKSNFIISQEKLTDILQNEKTVNTLAYREPSFGNYIRNVETGRNIGIDKYGNSGQPGTTSKLTVITDKKGNLVTTYPGTTKIP